MGDLQDPKMEVLYHMFGHILGVYSPYIGLIYARYLKSRILKWPLNKPCLITRGYLGKRVDNIRLQW